jgi:hypothetical protein
VSDGHDGFLVTTPALETRELGRQVGVLGPGCATGGLDQGLSEPLGTLASLS